MADYLSIDLIDDPIYTKACRLGGTQFQGHQISLYAECRENHGSERSDDQYEISFFFSADGYGDREFVIGIYVGNREMSQQELDGLIKSWIRDVIADRVEHSIDQYLIKEALYEQWLKSQEEEQK